MLRLYDYFYHKEHLFIVTELLRVREAAAGAHAARGLTRQLITQANLYEFQKYNRDSGEAPYFTCSRLQRIARQVLCALAFMHSLQVLHCDLKPENILIRSYSRCLVKVIDVGSSCFATDHLSSYVQSRSYRAPEVILGLPYDGRIDVWSLGCILAELYSGYVLFQNDSLATLLARCVGILGPVPPRLLQGRHAHKFFTRAGALYERDDEAGRGGRANRLAGLPALIGAALNTHGTRAVQKLVETLSTPEQVSLAVAALSPGVVILIKDLNGNHVVQRCLQRLAPDASQFIYDAAAAHCVEVATHRHGCCVLQRCIDHAAEAQRKALVAEVAAQALVLAQDPFGNYVVQYVLNLGLPWASALVMARLGGAYAELSMQKFSSNVVEKCLKLGEGPLEECRAAIVRELTASPALERLLQDPYGNYVVQSALSVTKGALHAELVERIRPHMAAIKSSPFGKRILARSNLLHRALK